MKDAYIYDGSAWQSLKGPPGPSAVSADAGNTLTLGSDGLVMLDGDTTIAGTWTATGDVTDRGASRWVRSGRYVTVTACVDVDSTDSVYKEVGGLPFLPASYVSMASVYLRNDQIAVGVARLFGGEDAASLLIDSDTVFGEVYFSLTYETDDPHPFRGVQ